MIISKTPYRISLFGGGTDYPQWYNDNEGLVIAYAINKYCYILCRKFQPFFDYLIKTTYSKMEECKTVNDVEHPVIKACLNHTQMTSGIEIYHSSDLPARSGMGSSSSFTVGLLHALSALDNKIINKELLAKEAIYIEHDILKECVGSQDQITTAFGGFNSIRFKKDEFILSPINLASRHRQELEEHTILLYTNQQRFASNIAQNYFDDFKNKKHLYNSTLKITEEALKLINKNFNIKDIGELLNEAWKIKKSFSSNVSTPLVDSLYETAKKHGCYGGKILGAGGGGFLLMLAPPDLHENIATKLNCKKVSVKIDYIGSTIL